MRSRLIFTATFDSVALRSGCFTVFLDTSILSGTERSEVQSKDAGLTIYGYLCFFASRCLRSCFTMS